jgi:hypothetical protein
MIASVVGALILGLIGIFSIVIGQGMVSSQNTTGWSAVLVSEITNIPVIIGVVCIIGMFVLVIRMATSFGGAAGGGASI